MTPEHITIEDAVFQLRLLVDGVVRSVTSFESEDTEFAPDISCLSLNWTGTVIPGAHTVSVEYRIVTAETSSFAFNSVSPRSEGEGASMSILVL